MVAQVLAANVALNSLTNVYTYHLGVGAEDGTLWLGDIDYSSDGNFGGVSLDAVACPESDARPKYRVCVVRLDDFYDQPRLDFMKIDVEGMEADVLRGAGGLIQRHKPVIYAENDRPEKSPELIRLIRSHGYQPVAKVADPAWPRRDRARTLNGHGDGQETGGAPSVADVGGHGGPSDE